MDIDELLSKVLEEAGWLDSLVDQHPREWQAFADTIANNLRAAVAKFKAGV